MTKDSTTDPSLRVLRELAAGGISCAAASALFNPMDVVKVRLQTQMQSGNQLNGVKLYNGFSHGIHRILAEEGVVGLWVPGLLASMMREISYSSLRVGLYPLVRNTYAGMFGEGSDAGFMLKMLAGMTTGAIGSAIANPTDLVKIRLQGEAGRVGPDGKLMTGLSAGSFPLYRSTFHGFATMWREGGIAAYYKGVSATMVRAALLTSGQLASYDHSKHLLKSHGVLADGVPLHIVCSLIAGLAATTFGAPADIIKTRYMNDRGTYRGVLDCLYKTVRYDGPRALFRGWVPSYLRLGPHFIISLPLLEQCRRLLGLGYFA